MPKPLSIAEKTNYKIFNVKDVSDYLGVSTKFQLNVSRNMLTSFALGIITGKETCLIWYSNRLFYKQRGV